MMSLPAGRAATARVPATSANLGPGFDACGLALAWYDDVTAVVTTGDRRVDLTGEGAEALPRGEDHLVVRTVGHGLAELGVAAPGLHLVAHNTIPHGRGLGSSAAALVAGLALAWGLARPDRALDLDWVVATASRLEGHPDNVAAAALGGYTIAWLDAADRATAVRLQPVAGLAVLALVPEESLPTTSARGALPDLVPHRDAARTAGRAALLTHALTAAPALLVPATEDWLHQRARAAHMARSFAVVEQLRATGHAAVISGAGPTVLVLGERDDLAGVAGRPPQGFAPRLVGVGRGVSLVPLDRP